MDPMEIVSCGLTPQVLSHGSGGTQIVMLLLLEESSLDVGPEPTASEDTQKVAASDAFTREV